MTIAVDREHIQFREVLSGALEDMGARAATRAALDLDEPVLPPYWADAAGQGWLGLHLPEDVGGSGAGLLGAALLMEAVGEHVAAGPFLPTVLSSAVLSSAVLDERAGPALRDRLLPVLATGRTVAATGLDGSARLASGTLDGNAGLVLGAAFADVLLLAAGDDLVVVARDRDGVTVEPVRALDRGLGAGRVQCRGVSCSEADVVPGGHRVAVRLARVLAAAQAAGGARALTGTATEYAKVRRQFGRTIGSFQSVKHLCADMLVAAETAAAVAWDAARGTEPTGDPSYLGAAVAATVALPAYMRCAETNVQVHGGIGFTWEHDAHLHLRRAGCLAAVFGPHAADDVYRAAVNGVPRDLAVPLPDGAEQTRDRARAFVDEVGDLATHEQAEAFAASGFLAPEWPRPYGIDADTLTQYVVKEETRALPRPRIEVPWVPMTVGREGTDEQAARLLPGSLRGDVRWCQLSSEPEAGSDAAAVRTRASRTEGGWLLNGQKVWTSHAGKATHGLATVRTDPDAAKHAGLSLMIVDMTAPGITIRPLREIVPGERPNATEFGDTSFNEIFLDDVFVPDENLVGAVNDGWHLVRELLGNERRTIGERGSPIQAQALVDLVADRVPDDAGLRREAGHAVAEEQAVAALNLRRLLRAMHALPPTAEANVAKIVNSERMQRLAEAGMRTLGVDGADETEDFGWFYLRSRFTTIGGGTSQIARNVLGERVLGLPRDV